MTWRRLARAAGLVLVVAALAYLSGELMLYRDSLAARNLPAGTWATLAALGVLYGAAMLLLAEQWHRIVGLFGELPRARTWPSYTATLVARYLPGNVFHIVGRAAWLQGGALSNAALLRASALELALTPVAAAVLLLPLLPFLPQPIQGIGLALVTGILIALAACRPLRRLAAAWLPRLAPALIFGVAFMAVLAATFAAVTTLVAPVAPHLAAAVALAAWLAGYATPGAPGGIGVREATFVALLSTMIPTETALLAAVLFRGITILGDVVCFFLGAGSTIAARRVQS
ncbi:hypothetical protein DLJ49_20550 [Rhodovulum sp. 12E13]|nr:hypothetical protein DLJ49_20550 [Rhodovulum sp. 12E13]